jgi:ABC-type transport system substrate-binding protein
MTAILKNWADNLGIKTGNVVALDDAAYQVASKAGDYDVMYVGAANGPTGDRGFLYLHSSTAYPAGGNGAFPGDAYINPAFDKIVEAARSEFDTAKQDALYQQACKIMHDDLPVIYLWQSVRYHVASPKLQNLILIPAAGGGSYYDAAELWTKAP